VENHSSKYRHLTGEEIFAYHSNQLSAQEMHRMEKHMQECSFCEEAMSGVSKMDDSLKSASVIRELRNKGRKKFNQKRSVFDFIGINNLIVLLFVIGMLIFVAMLLMRIK
jgi:hypothetical protein